MNVPKPSASQMLVKIPLLRDYRCFSSFKWPEELPPFKRYNLVFGWNGSGKSTLSRLLGHVQRRADVHDAEVRLKFTDCDVAGDGISAAALPPLRVFNAQYVQENVLQRISRLTPIVFLGEAQVGAVATRDALAGNLQELVDTKGRTSREAGDATKAFSRFCEQTAKSIKDTLRGSGASDRYANYDKSSFSRSCDAVLDGKRQAERLGEAEASEMHARRARSNGVKAVVGVPECPDAEPLFKRAEEALSWTPDGAMIDALNSDAELSSWLRTGLTLHEHRGEDTCLFCGSDIKKDRLGALKAHFNDRLRREFDNLQALEREAEALQRRFESTPIGVPAGLFAEEIPTAQSCVDVVIEAKVQSIDALEALLKGLRAKKADPTTTPNVEDAQAAASKARQVWTKVLRDLVATVEQHNKAVDNLDEEREAARTALESDFLAKSVEEYQSLRDATRKYEDSIALLSARITKTEQDLRAVELKLRNTGRAAEFLNADLRAYLGHGEIQLAASDEGYIVQRHGKIAEGLSEGEKTALALLYFLRSLEGEDCKLEKTLVVIDDPVSSLDAGALYTAFSFIRARTEQAKQLFILTHDATFFRLVKGWFVRKYKKSSSLYQVRANIRDGRKQSELVVLPELLQKYESEYQHLFSIIYEASQLPADTPLEHYQLLPNAARRFIEQFLSFRHGHAFLGTDGFLKALEASGLPPEGVTLLFRFLNIESHGDAVGEPAHDFPLLAECPAVLKAVVELVKREDEKHFNSLLAALGKKPYPEKQEGGGAQPAA